MERTPTDLEDARLWEDAIFEALEITRGDVEPRDLAQALLEVSLRHTEPEPGTGRLVSGRPEPRLHVLSRGLFFARRSFLIGRHIARTLPGLFDEASHLEELGAGFAPFLLALAPVHTSVSARERFPDYTRPREALLRAVLGRSEEAASGPRGTIFGFSFREFTRGDVVQGAELVRERRASSPGGLLIVEPGDKTHSEHLGAVRDLLAEDGDYPASPCPRVRQCPMRTRDKDWCHFTLDMSLGPVSRQAADIAQRGFHRAHFSYLFFGPKDERSPSRLRWIASFTEGKQKARGLACGPEGLVTFCSLKRDRTAYAHLLSVPANAEVTVEGQADSKGDGLRIKAAEQLRILSPGR